MVAIERKRCRCFETSLRPQIRTLVTALAMRCDYAKLVDVALRAERSLGGKRSSTMVS